MRWFNQWGLLLLVAVIAFPACSVQASPPPVTSSVSVSATIPFPTGDLRLTGYASPNALVTFLRQGVVAGTVTANSASFFDKTLTGMSPGTYSFSIFGSDAAGRTTLTLSFDTTIISGSTITLSGFLLPPTISVVKPELKRPDAQIVNGASRHDADVTSFFTDTEKTKTVRSNSAGAWESKVTDIFHLGPQNTQALVQDGDGNQSILSQVKAFMVVLSADLNVDNLVNLTDFSILMFNYARADYPNKAADINDNSQPPDLVDFSVMMFHWTGG